MCGSSTFSEHYDLKGFLGVLHDVLDRVYFRPVGKQQAAAADLRVSERTLKSRLRKAETQLIETLRELQTGSP